MRSSHDGDGQEFTVAVLKPERKAFQALQPGEMFRLVKNFTRPN
jgi:hypothetical protein